LDNIYTRLTTNASATEGDHSLSAGATPTTTQRSLKEIYEAIPTIDASKVAIGTTYLGVAGMMTPGSSATAQILKTGSVYCGAASNNYGSYSFIDCTGTKLDGEVKVGIARSFTDNGDDTVTDNKTALMWQRCPVGQAGFLCNELSTTLFKFDDGNGTYPGIDYCDNLTFAGYSDWRLPNRFELESLIDLGRYNPAIDPHFLGVNYEGYYTYMSSTVYAQMQPYIWSVSFYSGAVATTSISTDLAIRCVRKTI
jgi:hypothetical protein